MILDLSLTNTALYAGLRVEDLAGRATLVSPPEEAVGVMAKNLSAIQVDTEEVILTGSMAIWAYLAVFHFLHGRTRRIYYEDGRGTRILVAAHG